jgi:hypothetical protein
MNRVYTKTSKSEPSLVGKRMNSQAISQLEKEFGESSNLKADKAVQEQ